MTRVAVTGATGALGGQVARLLADAGVEQRLLVRSAGRAPRLPGASVAVASYGDQEASRAALTGIDLLLMVSAAEDEHRVQQHRTFVDAAVDAGVRHLVYTSFVGVSPDASFTLVRDHFATEQHIEASGLTWTFLRDNLYADVLPLFADGHGVLRGPAGTGRLAAVARADCAAAAAEVLLHSGAHEAAAHRLTGPEALTLDEAAATMSRVLGRPFSFQDETLEEAYASRAGTGAPPWQLDAWVSTYTAIAAGELADVTDDLPRLLGRPATSLAQLLAGS